MSGLPATDLVGDVFSLGSNLDEYWSSFLRDYADEDLFNPNNNSVLLDDHCASDSCLHNEQFPVFNDDRSNDGRRLISSAINNLDFMTIEELDELTTCGFDNSMPEFTTDRCANGAEENNDENNNNNMFVSAPPGDEGGVQLHNEDEGNNNNMFVSVPVYCGSDLPLHNEINNEEGLFTSTTGNNMFIPPRPGDCGSLPNEYCNNEKGMFGVQLHSEDGEGNNNMFIAPPGDCGSDYLRLHNECNNDSRGVFTSATETGVQLLNDEDEAGNNYQNNMFIIPPPGVCESDHLHNLPNENNNNLTWDQCLEIYSSILQDNIPQNERTEVQDCSWSLPVEEEQHQRKRKGKRKSSESVKKRECSHCGTTETPQWRSGPQGKGTLCNACGFRFKAGNLIPEYRPASSPTFDGAKHSNFQKRISKMKSTDSLQPRQLCIRQNHPVALGGLEQGYKDSNYLREDSNAVIYQVHEHVGYPVHMDGNESNFNQNMHN